MVTAFLSQKQSPSSTEYCTGYQSFSCMHLRMSVNACLKHTTNSPRVRVISLSLVSIMTLLELRHMIQSERFGQRHITQGYFKEGLNLMPVNANYQNF